MVGALDSIATFIKEIRITVDLVVASVSGHDLEAVVDRMVVDVEAGFVLIRTMLHSPKVYKELKGAKQAIVLG